MGVSRISQVAIAIKTVSLVFEYREKATEMKCLHILLRLAMVTTAVFLSLPAIASDHFDGPGVLADPSSDINDMYVFKSLEDSSRLVLVLNCLPNAGPSAWFSDALEYRFRLRPVSIEGTGEKAGFNVNEQEIVFSCTFGDLRKTTKGDVQRGKLVTPKV